MSSCIVGIGNRYRSDDAVGSIVAQRLGGIQLSGDGAQLLELFKQFTDVILIDAVQSGAPPGTIFRFDGIQDPLSREMFATSTHAFGLVEAVELARTLVQLPRTLIIYGIEGTNFSSGTTLSPEVSQAIEIVVTQIHDPR